jgi:acyl carrier protein
MQQEALVRMLKESLFVEELDGWDSLGRLRVTVLFQEQFAINVDAKTLLKCSSIGDLVALVRDKLTE